MAKNADDDNDKSKNVDEDDELEDEDDESSDDDESGSDNNEDDQDDEDDSSKSEDPKVLKEALARANKSHERTLIRLKEKDGLVPERDENGDFVRNDKGKIVFIKKPTKKTPPAKAKQESDDDRSDAQQSFVTPQELDEKILRSSKGYNDKDIEQLKAIASGKKISILEAEQDELFVNYWAKREAEEKKKKAKMGANKGSGSHETRNFNRPMTEDEHKKQWEERQAEIR